MKRFFRMYSVEQKLFFRSPDVFIFNLLMPLIAFIIIALVGGSKDASDSGLTYLESGYVSLTTIGICCSAFMSIPIVLVEYRSQKVLRRMYCSPASPVRVMACDIICSGVMSVISFIMLSILAVCMGYRMRGNVFIFILVWIATMLSMFSIGLMIASLCRTTKSMNVATTAVYFPMLIFSGAMIPLELFPKGLQNVLEYLPLGIGIDLLKSLSLGNYDNMWKLAILFGFLVVCGFVSIKTFKWE